MRRLLALVAAICLVMALTTIPAPADAAPKYVSARTLLSSIPVHGAVASKYNPDLFSYGEDLDADEDGCDTRKEVLIRDAIRIDLITPSCKVEGEWKSIYNNLVSTNPLAFTNNRVVSLREAWASGANKWSHRRAVAYNNDLGYKWSLQLESRVNEPNGFAPNPIALPSKNHCTYVKAWVGIKARWHLSVDLSEKAQIVRELNKCKSLLVLNPGVPNLKQLLGY